MEYKKPYKPKKGTTELRNYGNALREGTHGVRNYGPKGLTEIRK